MSSLFAPKLLAKLEGDPRLETVANAMRGRLLERLQVGAFELPLLPAVAVDVLAMASRADSDERRLAERIRCDQALTAHLLRIVNSPLYRSRAAIESIPQAISRLGFAKIRHIALVIACKQRVFSVRGFEPEVRRAFRHSLATALFAQEIAVARQMNEEEAFLAGLLHDVGRPVLFQAVSDLRLDPHGTDRAAVLAIVAELHAKVGTLLARKWRLPPRVCEAIAHHHDPSACPANPLPMLISLADDLSTSALDAGSEGDAPAATHWTLAHLKLAPDIFTQIQARRPALMQALDAVA